MSAKLKFIAIPFASLGIFLLLLGVLDRESFFHALLRLTGGKRLVQEKAEVLKTIKDYNLILTDFYASGGVPAMLNRFPASKMLRHAVFRDLGYLKNSGKILVYDLAELTPVTIEITSPGTAEAVVFEEWNYMYQNAENRKPLSLPKGMGHGFKYRLKRQKGKWIVIGWDPADVKEPEKKDGFYF